MRSNVVLVKLLMRRKLAILLLFMLYSTLATLGYTALGYLKLVFESYDHVLKHIVDLNNGVVITSYAISPFTSLVDPEVLEKRLHGVANITVDYYFITLGYVNGRPIIVVGSSSVEEGCAIVGGGVYRELAESGRAGIAILSPFTDETVFLKVCGESAEPYILVNHAIAARLRGVPSKYYTIAVVKSSVPESLDQVFEALGAKPDKPGLLSRAIALIGKVDNNITGKLYSSLSDVYFTRLGVNKEYFVYFTSSAITILLIGLPLAGYAVVIHVERVLKVLRTVGVSKLCLFRALCIYVALPLVPASLVAYSALNFMPRVEVLGFTLTIAPTVLDVVLMCVFTYILSIVGIVWGLRSEVE